jgi:Fic family protein
MVMNNYRAIQFIRENRNIDISPTFILELQKILTEDTLDHPEQVGRFRTENDTISVVDDRDDEVMHVPPPASELPKRLKALCDFANRPPHGKDFVHPVIAACVLHFQLGFDHPFCDGNGRTARALFYWMMLRCGYWLFEYLPISRLIYRAPAKYARAFLFCETDDFDVTYFLMYKARIIAMARRDLKEYISEKQSQIAQARRLLSSDGRLNHRQQEIVLHATRNQDRYFTISEHQNKYGIAYGTARADFLQLAAWKYLKKVTVGKRFEFTADEKVSGLDKRPVIKDPQLFPDAPRVIHSK